MEGKSEVIKDSMEFMTGEEGWFVKKTNALFTATVKVDKNPTADTIEEELTFHAKKIPGPVFRSWQAFCRDVCAKAKGDSEAGLILLYHPERKTWDAFPPKQDLTVVKVDFSGVTEAIEKFRKENGKEWLIAGTLHSHPGGASPSTTDEGDEEKMDGVHIIVPFFGREGAKGINCHITASKSRFVVKEVPSFLVDFNIPGTDAYPKEWIDQCKFGGAGWKRHDTGTTRHETGWYGHGPGSYMTGNEFFLDGEGSRIHTVTVNNGKMNVLHESFDAIEPKALLKKLGFGKAERKWLCHNFEEDMKDLVSMFDYCRDALRSIKEVRGEFIHSDRIKVAKDIGRAVEVSLETIHAIANRILEQSSGSPKKAIKDDGKEEEEDETETTAPTTEASGKVDDASTSVHGSEHFDVHP